MAIITPSALISEIRGSVGTQTFSRNHYRAYVKTKTSPVQPDTAHQLAARSDMSEAVAGWQALTDANRLLWQRYARDRNSRPRLGEEKPLNGFNLYCRHFIWGQRGVITFATPPGKERPQPRFISWSADSDAYSVFIRWQTTGGTPNFGAQIWASDYISDGNLSWNSPVFKEVDVISVNNDEQEFDLNGDIADAWGKEAIDYPGTKMFLKVRLVDRSSGQFTWLNFDPFIIPAG